MSFLYGFLLSLCLVAWACVYLKIYQLCGYNPKKFFDSVITFSLAFGDKNHLRWTKRVWRFIILVFLLNYALCIIIFAFLHHWALILLDLFILFVLQPMLMIVAHFIISPLEKAIKNFYIRKAKKVLSVKHCIKIGITGSYGKTSTKNILAEILSKEYKVCVTPQNYNTEMGITKTILEKLDDDDIFIAEMGARQVGDIKSLAKIVDPDYAVITTIGPAHIETFGSLENIEKTKFELIEYLKPSGRVIVNCDNTSSFRLYKKCNHAKFLTCREGGYCYAKDVKVTVKGCSFNLVLDGKAMELQTKLLGQCNVDNIATAVALAHQLKISEKDIVEAVAHLKPTPHRLELINTGNMRIIDDSYNSNMTGAKEALNVLSLFNGRKIVVTPGFVELGKEQSMANFKFGAMIADVADYVIIMNETNKNYLLSGLISHNFDQKNIFFATNRESQKKMLARIITKDCVVLFENDLPDNFD